MEPQSHGKQLSGPHQRPSTPGTPLSAVILQPSRSTSTAYCPPLHRHGEEEEEEEDGEEDEEFEALEDIREIREEFDNILW